MKRHKLVTLRKKEGLSQKQLAERIGKDQSLISRLEEGSARLTDDIMILLRDEMKWKLDDMLEDTPSVIIQNSGTMHNGYNHDCEIHMSHSAADEMPPWAIALVERVDKQQAQTAQLFATFQQALERLSQKDR